MRAELPFAGGSERGPNRTAVSLVLGGALLLTANFGLRLSATKKTLGLSGDAAAEEEADPRAAGTPCRRGCGREQGPF